MKKNITKISLFIFSLILPVITYGQFDGIVVPQRTKTLNDLAILVVYYLNIAIRLVVALAIVLFVWNIFRYFILSGDDVGKKKEAGLYVMWSVIGFFLILSFWGLVFLLTNTFKLDSNPSNNFFGTFRSSGVGGPSTGGSDVFGGAPSQRTRGGSGSQKTTSP